MTGVEGYVESAASGMLAAINCLRRMQGKESIVPEDTCVCGALARYIAAENAHFQPMNANFGILRGMDVKDKKQKKKLMAERALAEIDRVRAQLCE